MKKVQFSTVAATIVVCAALVCSTAARASTTVDFTFNGYGGVKATGYFTYSSSNTDIGYGDLSAFYLHFNTTGDAWGMYNGELRPFGGLYWGPTDALNTNLYFDYNTVTHQFVEDATGRLLWATNIFDDIGYFIGRDLHTFINGQPYKYLDDINYTITPPNGSASWSDITYSVVTPLPAALPLFATGAGLIGLLGWRRKRKAAAAIVAA